MTSARRYAPFLVIAVIVGLFPMFAADDYQIKIATFVGINAILAIGLCMLMGYAGQVSLGHAAFYGIGAYTSALLTTRLGAAMPLGLAAAVLTSAVVALAIGIPTLRLKGHYLAMATLGFGEIVYVFFVELSDLTGGPSGFVGIPAARLGGLAFDSAISYYVLVWAIALLILMISRNIIESRVGRALRALHESELAAQAVGVNTARYKIEVFVLSAAYAGLAGSLYAHLVNFISPSSFTVSFSVLLLTMVVVGGMTSIWGALIGAALLTTLPEYLRVIRGYDLLVYASTLMLTMIFLPKGLVPGLGEMLRRGRDKLRARTMASGGAGIGPA